MREDYLDSMKRKDKEKQESIRKIIEERLMEEQKHIDEAPKLEEKIKCNNIIDTNDGRHLLNILGVYLHGRMQTPDRMQRLRIHTQAK